MVEIPIRKGYSVQEDDTAKLTKLKELQDQHFIIIERDEILTCNKCGNILPVDAIFLKRGSGVCPGCGKTIYRSKTRKFQQRISKIQYDQIIKTIDKNLKTFFSADEITFDNYGRNWIIERDGKFFNISIFGVSTSTAFFSITGDEGIVLYLDGEVIRPKINNFNKFRFLVFDDPKLKHQTSLLDLVDALDHSHTLKYVELKEQFESFVSSTTPQAFESEFAPQLIDAIRANSVKLKTLFSRLQAVKNTIINTKFVNIGGPGQSDFFLIDLFDYLQDGLKPEKYGEVKCYTKSSFTMDDFGKALAHATSRDTLSIVSTDDIHPLVWAKIFEYRNMEKYYKHVIIDKDLILLLIHNLELHDLIK